MLLALLGALGASTGSPVIGGHPVTPGTWPDIAAVPFDGTSDSVYCTGTLIAPTVVITAGHCVIDPPAPDAVLVGTNSLAHPELGEVIPVAAVHEYPDSQNTLDLAILVLARPATTPPRALATGWARIDIANGATVAIAGYGSTDRDGEVYVDDMQEASTTITDFDCTTNADNGCTAPGMPDGELGAGGMGIDTCPGDSGGPLYLVTSYGSFLAGVTSRGYDDGKFLCSEGGIYERPDKVVAWIESIAGPVARGPDATIGPFVDGDALIDAHDPLSDVHRFTIEVPPLHGTAAVRDDGTLRVCPAEAGDDVLTVGIYDAHDRARSIPFVVTLHADGPIEGCTIDGFAGDESGCCSSSGGGSSIVLALGALAVLRRRVSFRPCG